MILRLVRMMRRKGTDNRYFVQRIPADVKSRAVGMTLTLPVGNTPVPVPIKRNTAAIRVSLRTADATEAKVRQAAIAGHLARVWESLRSEVRHLTQKEAVALAGEVYRRWTSALEDNPGVPEVWRKVKRDNRAAMDGNYGVGQMLIGDDARRQASLEERFGPFADLVLGWKAIRIDHSSRALLLQQIARAMDDAADKTLRNASGDYRPDLNAIRFPAWPDTPKVVTKLADGSATISGLLDGWAKEASAAGKASDSTREAYTRAVRKLIAFLGHDEASRVTPEDIVAFKDARLAEINPRSGKHVSAKTVNDGDLSGLKTVFGWGLRNRKVTTNPAAGITIRVADKPKVRPKGFTDPEAAAILRHALHYKPGAAEYPKTSAAKKWTPWLCAFTGARIGEMVQLRKSDLRREGKVWLIRITPEAGTVKGKRMREIPLHPQLVELGFPEFVRKSADGYLFFNVVEKGNWRGPWQAVKNRVGEFVREVVTDPNVKPNHGWRHRFITQARQYGIDQELRRMITGHTGEGVDERDYGDPAGLYREICKLPRYRVK